MTNSEWTQYKVTNLIIDFLIRNYWGEFDREVLMNSHPLELLEIIRTRYEDINYPEQLSYYLNLAAQ